MLNGVMQIKEASRIWGRDVRTLRAVFAKGVSFKLGVDIDKSDGTWLVTKESMERVYGKIYPNKDKKREAKVSDKYKLVVCNLGYEDTILCNLDGFEGTLRQVNTKIREITNGFKKKTIGGFSINYLCKGNIAPHQFNYDDTVVILESTEDTDRSIYVRIEE